MRILMVSSLKEYCCVPMTVVYWKRGSSEFVVGRQERKLIDLTIVTALQRRSMALQKVKSVQSNFSLVQEAPDLTRLAMAKCCPEPRNAGKTGPKKGPSDGNI
jgi:hypothetical protein